MNIIAIGASAGGVEAISTIVAALPKHFDAAIFVTLHIGAHQSNLPWIIERAGVLPAGHATEGEVFGAGKIYVAPPDHHMLVTAAGRIALSKGPRENWTRPAIDPLFRSAASAFGAAVTGVVLTGGLNDGTAGLIEIKRAGGVAVVHDPTDAFCAEMPRSALANVDVDYVVKASQIGELLLGLINQKRSSALMGGAHFKPQEQPMASEFKLERPVAVTCPDCGGALKRTELHSLTQFSCHIGHIYTAEIMLAAQFQALEKSLEQALRSLNERAELCRLMAEKNGTQWGERDLWESAREEALAQAEPLRALLTREWLQPSSESVVTSVQD